MSEMGDPSEVKQLLQDGYFLEMDLAQLQREHAELIAFNTVLDRKKKHAENVAQKYKSKVALIASLVRDPSDQEMTLKAIGTVLRGAND